jgi:GNAT superfamily N-acetyltransferase
MKSVLPFRGDDTLMYSITYDLSTPESRELGSFEESGYIVEPTEGELQDILLEANRDYGIYKPVGIGSFTNTTADHDHDYFTKGHEKYYTLFINKTDGSRLNQEELDFITALLNEGKYFYDEESNRFYEWGGTPEYGIGGWIGGTLIGGFLGYQVGKAVGYGRAYKGYEGGGEIDSKNIGVAKRTKVKKWYTKNYPQDDLGQEINGSIDFWTIYVFLKQGIDIYSALGVSDSLVRERVFEKLSEILNVDYETIYQIWLNSDNYEKGGSTYSNGGKVDEYSNWEGEIANYLSKELEVSYSDAQAIIEANSFIMAQSWGMDLTPKDTADKIIIEKYSKGGSTYAGGGGISDFTPDGFLKYAHSEISAFLESSIGATLSKDWSFVYDKKTYNIEPIIHYEQGSKKIMRSATFTILKDGEDVGVIDFLQKGFDKGKHFVPNSKHFGWLGERFEKGGSTYNDGAIMPDSAHYGLGGLLLAGGFGAYVGYKIGRAKPKKTGFKTEKKIARKVKSKAKELTSKKKYAGGGEVDAPYLQMSNLDKQSAEQSAKIFENYNKDVKIKKEDNGLYSIYTSSVSGDKEYAGGGEIDAPYLQMSNLDKQSAEQSAKIFENYNKDVKIKKEDNGLYSIYTSSVSGDKEYAGGGEIKIENEDERTTLSLNGIGSIVITETTPEYEFVDDISEDELENLDLYEDDFISKIEDLRINDGYKGKGYAKLLMNKALDYIDENYSYPIYLNASPMQSDGMLNLNDLTRFYEKFGFKVFKRQGNNNLMIKKSKGNTYAGGGEVEREEMEEWFYDHDNEWQNDMEIDHQAENTDLDLVEWAYWRYHEKDGGEVEREEMEEWFYDHDNEWQNDMEIDHQAENTDLDLVEWAYWRYHEKESSTYAGGGGVEEVEEYNYLYLKPTSNGLVLELTDEGIQAYNDEEIYEMYDLFEDINSNSEWSYIDNAGDVGLGLTDAPVITDGYYFDDDGEFTDEGVSDSRLYVWNDYMIKDLFDTLMEQGQVTLSEVKSKYYGGGETITKPRPTITPTETPTKPNKDNPYSPKVKPKPKADYLMNK